MCSFFLSMRRPLISTLFPYTTLFRSPVRQLVVRLELPHLADGHRVRDPGEHAQRLRSEEHTSELQSHSELVCRLLLEKKKLAESHGLGTHDVMARTQIHLGILAIAGL